MLILTGITLSACVQCRSSQKNNQHDALHLRPPPGASQENLTTVISRGDNRAQAWSQNGKKLLFISKARSEHPAYQLYEWDQETQMERRITYQLGDVVSAQYFHGGKIVYASSTDELKEEPPFLRNSLLALKGQQPPAPFLASIMGLETLLDRPTELYMSLPDGKRIQRLTERPGFDGELHAHPKEKRLLLTEIANQDARVRQWGEAHGVHNFINRPRSFSGHYAPDGHTVIWVEFSADFQRSELWMQKPPQPPRMLYASPGVILSPRFHPKENEIFFSSNMPIATNFEIFSWSLAKSCLRRWTFDPDLDIAPVPHPDGQHLYFSSARSGSLKIVKRSWNESEPCLPLNPPYTL